MQDIVRRYIKELEQAYYDNDEIEEWDEFVRVKEGVSNENITQIKELFPEVPKSLLELLSYADGTYFRMYGDTEICLYFLGSDLASFVVFSNKFSIIKKKPHILCA